MLFHFQLLVALAFSVTNVLSAPQNYARTPEKWTLSAVTATPEKDPADQQKEPGQISFQLSRGSKEAMAQVTHMQSFPKGGMFPIFDKCKFTNLNAIAGLNLAARSIIVEATVYDKQQQNKEGKEYQKLTYEVTVLDGDSRIKFDVGFFDSLQGQLTSANKVVKWESNLGKKVVEGTVEKRN